MRGLVFTAVITAMVLLLPSTVLASNVEISDYGIKVYGIPVSTIIIGTSTDVKPTNVQTGTFYLEKDTGVLYVFNGTDWRRCGGIAKLSELTVDSDLDMNGYNINNAGTINANTINAGTISTTGSVTIGGDVDMGGYNINNAGTVNADTVSAGTVTTSGTITAGGDVDLSGNNIVNTNDIMPQSDNVSSIGSASLRYNAIYVYAAYTGDIKLSNGWAISEAQKYGLGDGVVLVSPNGEVYRLTSDDIEKVNVTQLALYLATGLTLGVIGGAVGGIAVSGRIGS